VNAHKRKICIQTRHFPCRNISNTNSSIWPAVWRD